MAGKTVRAKFTVTEIHHAAYQKGPRVKLQPVYSQDPGSENKTFWEATPNGSLDMAITNEAAADHFELGKEYYVDFTPADEGGK